MTRKFFRQFYLLLAIHLMTGPAFGVDLITSDFTGIDLANQLPVTATSHIEPGLSISGWDFGPGLEASDGFDHRIAFRLPAANATTSTLSDAITRNEYLTITLTPGSPIELAGQRLSFGVHRNSWFPARRYSVFTSINGFTEADALFTSDEIPNATQDEVPLSFIFPNSPIYENLADPIEIRIYAHQATYNSHITSLSAFSITDPGPTYSLSVAATDNGTVTISPDGGVYTEGSPVVLTANPPEGYRFLRWAGTQTSDLNPLHLLMNQNHSITAFFEDDTVNTMGVGTNLSQIASWSTGRPFTDLMKYARSWVGHYQGGQTQDIPAGPQGYPLEVPFDFAGQNHYTARSIIPHFTGGDHTLTFEGTGSISFSNGPTDGSITYSGTGPLSTHTVPFNPPPAGNLFIFVDASDPADPVRNIKVHMPGFDDTTTFHPDYTATLAPFSTLRFMDWARTNSNPVTTWAERNTPDYYTQGVTVEDSPGVAIEYMIQLSNQLQKNPWFCIPHLADDNYVTQAAILIRDTLDPGLRFYLEYSNETWNSAPAFVQTYYARDRGSALGLSANPVDAGHIYSSLRSAQIWQIFADVFAADDPSRIINTLATWSARDEISELRLNALADPAINPTGVAAEVLAIAPYFGGGIDSDNLAENGYPTIDDIAETRSISEIAVTRTEVEDQKRLARNAGVKLVCYEGGQHWVAASNTRNDATLVTVLQDGNRDPRMGTRYTEYLDMLQEAGVDMFANFQHIEAWSQYGSWGIWEYHNQPLSEAPKAEAVLNWIAGNISLLPDIDGNSEIAFGNTGVGITNTVSFTIQNTGQAPLNTLSASASGTVFSVGSFESITVPPDQSTTLSVSFTPQGPGEFNETLQITSNDPDESPFEVALAGTGIPVGPPTNLNVAVNSTGTATLNWSHSPGSNSYRILRSTDNVVSNAVEVGTAAAATFQDSSGAGGVTYTYWVEASNGAATETSTETISTRYRAPHSRLAASPAITIVDEANPTSDFDNNGTDELILQNRNSGEIGWWYLDAGGNVIGGQIPGLSPGPEWQLVNHGDLDADGDTDFLLQNRDSGQAVVWTLVGTEFDSENTYPLDQSGSSELWKIAGVDGELIAWQHSETGQIAYNETGQTLFNTQPTNKNWKLIGLRDFNSDGNTDLFWQHQSKGTMAVWYLDSDKNLLSARLLSLQTDDPEWEVRGLGDWDGNGIPDIALQNPADGAIALWYLDGVTVERTKDIPASVGSSFWKIANSSRSQ